MAGGIEPVAHFNGAANGDAASFVTADGDEPSDEDKQTLRRVADKLPWAAFLVCIIELCERFTYYGLSGPFQNYIQNSYHGSLPGAIGLGQTGATGEQTLDRRLATRFRHFPIAC
jgi:proton-dependent oligopeptide transporter, POT family